MVSAARRSKNNDKEEGVTKTRKGHNGRERRDEDKGGEDKEQE